MKTSKWLILTAALALLALPPAAWAAEATAMQLQVCTAILADGLGPTGGTYQVGDVIEFNISISVPPSPNPPTFCTLTNVSLYFYPPPLGAHPYGSGCDGTANAVLIASGLTLVPGAAPFEFDSSDNAVLAYTVQPGDAGMVMHSDIATTFFIEGGTDMQCDEKAVHNTIACPPPCLEVTKAVDCGYSKVGDEVTYRVCITNCGDLFDLIDVAVTDDILGDISGYFPSTLAPGQTECADIPYVIQPGDEPGPVLNQAHFAATDACDSLTRPTVHSDIVTVTLLHPEFTVVKECVDDPIPGGSTEASYTVTVTNTGDVELDFTTDEAGVGPFSLEPDSIFQQVVTVPVPPGATEVCNDITVTATIPPEFCDLPNVIEHSARDCCAVAGNEGCTPGYWKNHPDCWECYDPDYPLCDVFTVPAQLQGEFCDDTLMDALNYGGGAGVEGAARNLFRHAAAALQNACDADVNYPMTVAGVIQHVNAALATLDKSMIEAAKGILAGYNESGCPQDAHCRPKPEGAGSSLGSQELSPAPAQDTEVQLGIALPERFSVEGYPNPANPSVTIAYALPMESQVKVDIFDVEGRSVATLVDGQMPAGRHSVVWDGRDHTGANAAGGVYFCRVQCCDGQETLNKVIKVR
jgi:hypothetical protein